MERRGLVKLCAAVARYRHSLHITSRCLSSATPPSAQTDATSSSSSSSSSREQSSSPGNGGQETKSDDFSSEAVEGPEPTFLPGEDTKQQSTFWRALKAAFAASLVAGSLVAAYVSYAYTSEEIEKKVSALRQTAETSHTEKDSLLARVENVLHSTSLKAAAGVAGLYLEIRKAVEDQVKGFAAPTSDKLLPDLHPQERHVFTLVLDLNETLVYSDWTRDRGWKTFKRPGAEAFLEHLAQFYELVVYTDQLPFTVDPILEKLDQKGCIRYRLAREATQYIQGKHYKDLSKLNRDPAHVMFLSAHAKETCLQPENAVSIKPWKLEADDTMLLDMLPFLEYVARYRPADVRPVLASYNGHDIPSEFLVRSKDYQRKMRELKSQNPFFRSSRSSS